jgi:hypothetical protein
MNLPSTILFILLSLRREQYMFHLIVRPGTARAKRRRLGYFALSDGPDRGCPALRPTPSHL